MEQITFNYDVVLRLITFVVTIAGAWFAIKSQVAILELEINTLKKEFALLNANLITFENKWGAIADQLATNSTKALHEIEKVNMYIQGQESRATERFTNLMERVSALEKHDRR